MLPDESDVSLPLLRAARQGHDFYRAALPHVVDSGLREVFQNLAGAKRRLIASFSEFSATEGAAALDPEFDAVARAYVALGVRSSGCSDPETLAQLRSTENSLLAAFERSAAAGRETALRALLRLNMARVRACAEQMSNFAIAS